MKITRVSMFTGKVNTMDLPVTEEQYEAYVNGALLQNAFPNLSREEREFIKSGVTPEEWDKEFGRIKE